MRRRWISLDDVSNEGWRPGGVCYALLVVGIAVVPWLAARQWEPVPPGDLATESSQQERVVIGADLLECRLPAEAAGLAEAVASLTSPPTSAAVRQLLEERRCTAIRYVVRVRFLLNDGSSDEITYVRRPYDEPWNLAEFLYALRVGNATAETSGGEPIRSLDLRSSSARAMGTVIEALLDSPTPRG